MQLYYLQIIRSHLNICKKIMNHLIVKWEYLKALPLLIDSNIKINKKLESAIFNIIFAKKIIQNKHQHKLIELAFSLKYKR